MGKTKSYKRIYSILAVPLLLSIVTLVTYLSIKYQWHYDIVIGITLIIVMSYIFICEKIIPSKVYWLEKPEDLKTDIT
ncbi:MAG: hypothetical protein HKO66_15285 [Saprospiraceae bacterium]|nr:hypothetical protein [Bacteroidia bacterium]NNE13639.1 hypothetical protein [Saprospiraceae bacterium]NNL93604.1 hypothetical protein [Saprospiraceae bacterium]